MGFANYYLQNYTQDPASIKHSPDERVNIIVTIPCYKEDKILRTLQSLNNCTPAKCITEVIVLINYPENASPEIAAQHAETFSKVTEWIARNENTHIQFHALLKALPAKTAGVGLARKIAMDEAIYRFNMLNKPNGIITGFDADSVCDTNYLTEIETFFTNHTKANGCSIRFEHPIQGDEFDSNVYSSIIQYELYLRYYTEGLRLAGLPYAYHTLGSSFAVTANAYIKQGGMNKRKAGEDFYFLHKIIALGNFHELNSTLIIPSPRPSDRVPFGTGAAINKLLNGENPLYLTFNPQAFLHLSELSANICSLFKKELSDIHQFISQLPLPLGQFLQENKVVEIIDDVNKNASGITSFEKRFYNWFNGLMVLQYFNVSHNSYYSKIPLTDAAVQLLELRNKKLTGTGNAKELLEIYRDIQKSDWVIPIAFNFVDQSKK
jgi:hypothetical protein